ncbi:ATP-binding protein [Gracilimonas tropica]|uniref:ATP-binding protein n=1 Tax=Gracilimonas tropica TaxID=454600 RepID=UPI0003662D36|nr:ATP-binding protein [Gracilimonas tropica]
MSNEFSREDILAQLRQETIKKFRDSLLKTLSDEVALLRPLLVAASEKIVSGQTDEALGDLLDGLKKQLHLPAEETAPDKEKTNETPVPWIGQIHTLTGELEEVIILPQEESRFFPLPSDSPFIKTGKLGKRLLKELQKAGKAVQAVFITDKKTEPVWMHTIPLRNLSAFHLMDVSNTLKAWNNEIHKIHAEVLLETDAWTLHSSGLIQSSLNKNEQPDSEDSDQQQSIAVNYDSIPDQDDMESFFQEVIKRLDSLEKTYGKLIKEQTESIKEHIFHAISITGTIERSVADYSKNAVALKEENVKGQIQQNRDQWNEILRALLNRCQLSTDFIGLYTQSKERIEGFNRSLEEFFSDHFESPSKALLELLNEAQEIFEDQEGRSMKEIQALSEKHLSKMDEHLTKKLIEPANDLIQDAALGSKLERFTSAIPEWTKNQRKQAILVESLDLTVLPPRFQLENVEWQSLVQRVLNNQIAKEFVPKQVKPEAFLSEITSEIQEIAQIVLTNIEIADEVKKSDEEDPLQVAKEGLERARTKLEEVIKKIDSKKTELSAKLTEKKNIAFSKLAMLLEKQNVNELRLAGAQYMAKETAVDWKIRLQVQWARFTEKTELFARFIWKKVKAYYKIISKFLGFAEKEKLEGDTTDLATFLSETDEQIASLPFIYRRLFDFHKEVEDRFYIRKPEQFDRLKKGYEMWQNNFPSSFSIVGEKGSGKSLFIRMLKEEILTRHDVIEINFQGTFWKPEEIVKLIAKGLKIEGAETFEDLTEAIRRKKKRVIVILENVQNCFVRNISGFDALEQLLLLISETNKEILWVASSTRYGWLYLDKVLNVVDYFTHAVETDNLTAQQIEELILRRHRASGYQLKFLPDETTKNSRSYKKHLDDEEKSQEYLKNRYFEKLAKLAEGNSSVAMIYWIRSIKEHDETHFCINPFEFGALNRIQELDSEELFALAAFMLHDFLTAEELSMTVHQSLRESQLTASRLSSQSILVEAPHGFSINQLIYRQIARTLKEANYIH